MANPETFEYQLRINSKVWSKPKKSNIMLQHNIDDRYQIHNPTLTQKQ